MKKILFFIALCFAFSITANASPFENAVEMVMEKFGCQITDDVSEINYLHNREKIKNKKLIASAMRNNLILFKGYVLDTESENYEPLANGIISKALYDDNCKLLTGTLADLETKNQVVFTDDTVYLIQNLSRKGLNYNDLYCCAVNLKNEVLYIWIAGEIKHPAIYRAKLFWAEDKCMILKELKCKVLKYWMDVNLNEYTEVYVDGNLYDKQFILNNIDKEIYLLADDYGGNIKILYVNPQE
ncbi:MAG: hypothetical protein IJQ50_00130 [Clostridia bacterium]|nr:hypothetical protein [Clostridia bacterium]